MPWHGFDPCVHRAGFAVTHCSILDCDYMVFNFLGKKKKKKKKPLVKKVSWGSEYITQQGGDSMCKSLGLIASPATDGVGQVLWHRVEIAASVYGSLPVRVLYTVLRQKISFGLPGWAFSRLLLQVRGNSHREIKSLAQLHMAFFKYHVV